MLKIDTGATRVSIGHGEAKRSGDNFCVRCFEGTTYLVLVDGLGHGPKAEEIGTKAIGFISDRLNKLSLEIILQESVKHFQSSRGFVVFLCEIDLNQFIMKYSGIGNITCKVFSKNRTLTLMGSQGIVGSISAKPRLKQISIEKGEYLLLHSDGVPSHLSRNQLMEALKAPADCAATQILADYSRASDDASVVVAKW